MIDEQINTFMASGQFRRRAAELESEIGADIALGKPVNLGDVGARRAGRAHARRVSAWFADFIMRNGETLVTPNGGHNEPRPPLRQCRVFFRRYEAAGANGRWLPPTTTMRAPLAEGPTATSRPPPL